MNILTIIAIFYVISKFINKAGTAASKVEEYGSSKNIWDQASSQMSKQEVHTSPVYEQVTVQSYQAEQAIRDKMAETKQRILESRGLRGSENTSILERSVKNTDVNKVDVTLATLEAEHRHSERVSAAEHYHPEDIISENMLGTIEDLIIKGYDGKLCFERDFLGEAMDMISHFTVPSDVPDYQNMV